LKEYIVKIKTLTPLWTGNAECKIENIRETGIIGSLRWWYEALVRGLGGTACDPTKDKKTYEGDKHCAVCELFGCTGWARKFRLEIEEGDKKIVPDLRVGARQDTQNRRFRTCAGIMSDNITLKFIPLRKVEDVEWWLLRKTIEIIESYGALGGRAAQGNGVIEVHKNAKEENNLFKQQFRTFHKLVKENLAEQSKCTNKTQAVPNLNPLFFMDFQIGFKKTISDLINQNVFWTKRSWIESKKGWNDLWDNYSVLPIAFHIRDAIKRCYENNDKRHSIFGKPGQGSRVFVSHGYKVKDDTVKIRVFGFGDEELMNIIRSKINNKEELSSKLFTGNTYDLIKNITMNNAKTGEELINEIKGAVPE